MPSERGTVLAAARRITVAIALLAAVGTARPALAADPPADPSSEATAPSGAKNSMPEIGQLLKLADKATSSTAGKEGDAGWSAPVKLAVVFTILALLPSLLVMMTSFTRIIIVLSFIRRALTTQAIPPNIALVGLALFLTIFIMSPTLGRINEQAIQPYLSDEIDFAAAVEKGNSLLKEFMLRQTRQSDLALFV